MRIKLQLKQKQELAMTQELRQSIEILSYSTDQLEDFLKKQEETNPAIKFTPRYPSRVNEFEEFTYKSPGLKYYLLDQVPGFRLGLYEEQITRLLIEMVDPSGYITEQTIEEMTFIDNQTLDKCLGVIQQMEPTGVGARDLSECLAIQARALNVDEIGLDIIANRLENLTKDPRILAEYYQVPVSQIIGYFETIKSMNPRPGGSFLYDDTDNAYIIPDVFVKKTPTGYSLEYNDDYSPRLEVDQSYLALEDASLDAEVLSYVKNSIRDVKALIDGLNHRRATILKISTAIVNRQGPYILEGGDMTPMTMEDIARDTGLHESTVSRSVNGKYMDCPRGICELRSFFTSAIESKGASQSSTTVKDKIDDLVQAEDKKKPLSDQKIADILNGQGIDISRRTVAKYRDSLKIPSSRDRKEFY